MDCSPPGSSVLGISQARVLEWVALFFSRRSSWPRRSDPCLSRFTGISFTTEPSGKPRSLICGYICIFYWFSFSEEPWLTQLVNWRNFKTIITKNQINFLSLCMLFTDQYILIIGKSYGYVSLASLDSLECGWEPMTLPVGLPSLSPSSEELKSSFRLYLGGYLSRIFLKVWFWKGTLIAQTGLFLSFI